MKTSIRTKLLIGFIACATSAGVVGGIGIFALLRANTSMERKGGLSADADGMPDSGAQPARCEKGNGKVVGAAKGAA